MKSITRTLIVLVIAITGLASCNKDEPDGLWPKMKWNAPQNLVEENGIYIVPAEGGEYTFECTNYSGVWLSLIEDNGEIVYPAADQEGFHSYIGKGFGVNCDHNHVKVSFAPLDASTESRSLTVDVTAGDIFYAFRFTQRR